jgi:taurine dioxygenase
MTAQMLWAARQGVEVNCENGTTIRFSPLGGTFGAAVEGVDLSEPLHPAVEAAVMAGFHAYHLLCFKDQQVEPAEELRALRLFNEISDVHDSSGPKVPGHPHVLVLSNIIGPDGEPVGYTNKKGMEWHTDGSGWALPPVASLMYAIEVPASGGETYFANGHVAYETLPPAERAALNSMQARYSWVTLHRWLAEASGSDEFLSQEEAARYPDVDRPLVRIHPVTGRKALWFSIEEIVDIDGTGFESSRKLLQGLVDHMVSTPHVVYRHDWEVGDLAIWDNRCLMHSVCEYNYEGQRRLMHQMTGKDLNFAI